MNNCEKWLFDLLSQNEGIYTEKVKEKAKEAGFTKSELKEARKTLGVKTFHLFDDNEGGDTENWYWYLPK